MFHPKQVSCLCKLYVFSGVYGHLIGEVPWEAADFCVDEQVATLVGESHLSGLVVYVSRQYQTKSFADLISKNTVIILFVTVFKLQKKACGL